MMGPNKKNNLYQNYQKYFLYSGKMIILQNELKKLHEIVKKTCYCEK